MNNVVHVLFLSIQDSKITQILQLLRIYNSWFPVCRRLKDTFAWRFFRCSYFLNIFLDNSCEPYSQDSNPIFLLDYVPQDHNPSSYVVVLMKPTQFSPSSWYVRLCSSDYTVLEKYAMGWLKGNSIACSLEGVSS